MSANRACDSSRKTQLEVVCWGKPPEVSVEQREELLAHPGHDSRNSVLRPLLRDFLGNCSHPQGPTGFRLMESRWFPLV